MSNPSKDIDIVGCRLSFNDLAEPSQLEGDREASYKAEFLLEPGSQQMQLVAHTITEVGVAQWGEQFRDPAWRQQMQLQIALRDGNTRINRQTGQVYDGYAGQWFVRSKRGASQGMPGVFTPDGRGGFIQLHTPGMPGWPYSGCYVIATLGFYASPDTPTKGVFCGLRSVAFFADGEAFGAAPIRADHYAQYAAQAQMPGGPQAAPPAAQPAAAPPPPAQPPMAPPGQPAPAPAAPGWPTQAPPAAPAAAPAPAPAAAPAGYDPLA